MLKIFLLSIIMCLFLCGCGKSTNEDSIDYNSTQLSVENIEYTTESFPKEPTETVLTEASTKIIDKEKNRLENIKITCSKLNDCQINTR